MLIFDKKLQKFDIQINYLIIEKNLRMIFHQRIVYAVTAFEDASEEAIETALV